MRLAIDRARPTVLLAALMARPASGACVVRWRVACWALAACGVADAIAVGRTSARPWIGWLLAAGWFVAAALCARRARGSARAGRGDDPGVAA
jgi:hypothetical protein